MAERRTNWTDQQRRAINEVARDVMVTASAGTGKTAVLAGRCVQIISDNRISTDVNSILVLTFTEAAAEEMRNRIGRQLRQAIAQRGGDSRLRRQLILLSGADISTVHSFCRRIISENFYQLGLDPAFAVISEDEQGLLKHEVLAETVDWAWEQSNLQDSLRRLLKRRDLRDVDGFLSAVRNINDFLEGVIDTQDWFRRAEAISGPETGNRLQADVRNRQIDLIGRKLADILERFKHCQTLMSELNGPGSWEEKYRSELIEPVSHCLKLLEDKQWPQCAAAILNHKKGQLRRAKDLDKEIWEMVKPQINAGKDEFEKLKELAVVNPDYVDRVAGAVGQQSRMLTELVKKFRTLYAAKKKELNCLDFADLEHNALKLLTASGGEGGEWRISSTAAALRKRYKYIFVDEYQDINPVQHRLLEALSGGDNLFGVGDVKQSIYAFRGAEPKIFLRELQMASDVPEHSSAALRVPLQKNFRSREEILDFVNKVFGRIMRQSVADVDYDESARLQPGRPDQKRRPAGADDRVPVELHLMEKNAGPADASQTDDDFSRQVQAVSDQQRSAMLIADRIKQMVGADTGEAEFEIVDEKTGDKRPVQYGDIVVLMRSPAQRVNEYTETLELAGVPASSERSRGFSERTELSDCLCLLKVLDNPQRDIELAAVLRSPFFGVSDTELAMVRLDGGGGQKGRKFYDCLLNYIEQGPDSELASRLEAIVEQIERWRRLCREGKLAELIWRIYRESGYLSFVTALPNGQTRRGHLLKLHDRAVEFEGFASSRPLPSLRRFVEFVEKLDQAGQEFSGIEPEGTSDNAVRIMSIHKSKGLEFPVVILAELNTGFNFRDSNAECVADLETTIGLKVIDSEANARLSSLSHQVIADEKKAITRAEEMRILYVGMTRAKERLMLVGREDSAKIRAMLGDGFYFGPGPIPAWKLRSCGSCLEWVLYGLSDSPVMHEKLETGLGPKPERKLLEVEYYDTERAWGLARAAAGLKRSKDKEADRRAQPSQDRQTESLYNHIKQVLGCKYPFEDIATVPAKVSVTEFVRRDADAESVAKSIPKHLHSSEILSDGSGTIDGKRIGSGVHLVISQLDMSGPVDKGQIEQTKKRLVEQQCISEELADCIDSARVAEFFASDLGRLALEAYPSVMREWGFSIGLGVSEWDPSLDNSDETIIVQGIADMVIDGSDGLRVVDFKTDRISADHAQQRAQNYRRQLELYAGAAERILERKVVGKYIYFIHCGRTVEIA